MQLFGAPSYGRGADALRLVGRKIAIEQFFEVYQNILVRLLAGVKLTVVESSAIVQQQLNERCDDGIAMVVGVKVDFSIYLLHAVDEGITLLLRYMQCLVGFVREEGVVLDVATELGTTQQFWTEIECVFL